MKKSSKTLLVSTKEQFKMYLDPDLIARLKRAAAKAGRDSGQEIAEEVLLAYLPVWTTVNDVMQRAVSYQTKRELEEASRPFRTRQQGVSGRELSSKSDKTLPADIPSLEEAEDTTNTKKQRRA